MESESFQISQFIRLRRDNLLVKRTGRQANWVPMTDLSRGDQILVHLRSHRTENRSQPQGTRRARQPLAGNRYTKGRFARRHGK